jgi:TetR/AcrR family transcriptional regulator, transcriptional repressor for nem operon
MARPKEFDRDNALGVGIKVFWRKGYAATTTGDLAKGMGIGRQSFYDTFGDKRRCYIEALRTYTRNEVRDQFAVIRGTASPLTALHYLLLAAADWPKERRSLGCMAVNALAEFGAADPEIAEVLVPSSLLLEQSVTQLLREAKAKREVNASLDVQRAASALLCTRMGIMLSAKAGQSPKTLRQIADFTVDQLGRR